MKWRRKRERQRSALEAQAIQAVNQQPPVLLPIPTANIQAAIATRRAMMLQEYELLRKMAVDGRAEERHRTRMRELSRELWPVNPVNIGTRRVPGGHGYPVTK